MEGALGVFAIPPMLALDGGTLIGAPSTLVNVNLTVPVVERAGVIPTTEIERVLNDI
jgi:tRNA A37 threonylcarbamoyladenosine synthetase subunit TsaC/SUA5/YrdC